MKRIIVCLDGTWNTAAGFGPTTNIVAIRDGLVADMKAPVPQRIYYDEGVGTSNPIDKFTGGALGIGVGDNVRQAYKYIARHYERGDEIYLIGFSRGAFTARSVAGYIAACGLMKKADCTTEREAAAWNYYRTMPKDRPAGDQAALAPFCHPGVKIKCVAVFDTVGALGIPGGLSWIGKTRFAFHDTQLNICVENCLHAVAIDEKRNTFVATMWEQPFNPDGPVPKVQQVWFPGVHCDIGGGYADNDLSRLTLEWMLDRLSALGVEFLPNARPQLAKRNPKGVLHESRSFPLYVGSSIRPNYRPIDHFYVDEWSARGSKAEPYRPIFEFVHRSALDRWMADMTYRPPNLKEVLPMIANGYIEVIDWNGVVMPLAAVQDQFGAALPRKPA